MSGGMVKREMKYSGRRMEGVRELFRKEGIKLTHQRLEVLNEISKADDHPSAEELYRRIRERLPTISLDTIYRTLGTLERLGLISRVEVLDNESRFDPNTGVHHHLVCVLCKRVEDFSWPSFDRMKAPGEVEGWGRTMSSHVELRGICNACVREGAAKRGRSSGKKH